MNETSTQRRAEPWSRVDRVPDGRQAPRAPEHAGSVRLRPGKVWGLVGLVALTAVTSLVVATISTWLVPAYMAAMALIFAAPRPTRPAEVATTLEEAPAEPPEVADSPQAVGVEGTPDEGRDGVAEAPEPAGAATEPTPAKPRKRRGKGKRAGKGAATTEASTSQPTWIRVGPGKFVRADVQAAPPDSEAGSPAETDPTTLTAADLPIEPEASLPATIETDGVAEAVGPPTHEDAAPASPSGGEPSEINSPAPFSDDEVEPMEPVEEYGIAPSALAGASSEEYGIAPSALAETWGPEALPDDVAGDEPEPATDLDGPGRDAEDETWREARSELMGQVEVEDPVDEPRMSPEIPTPPVGLPEGIAPPIPERLAPEGTACAPREAARTTGLGLIRRLRERRDRRRPPRQRGAAARPSRSGRVDGVRVRRADRGRRRSDPTGRRPHPRSPPRRA